MATTRLCSIPDCGKRAHAHGWCNSHYGRWRHHGDPHAGGPTRDGAPMRFIEEVAIPFTGDECLTWPFGKSNNGYARIGKGTLVTRLVCEAIHGKPAAKMDAAHSCGNGHLGCVNPKHLRWATHLENGADMAAHGRTKRGRKHFACKLTEDSVRQIRALRGMLFQREIAAKFGITRMTVNDIHSRRNWAWLDD